MKALRNLGSHNNYYRRNGSLTRIVVERCFYTGHIVGVEEGFLPHAHITGGPKQQLFPVELGPHGKIYIPKVLLWGSLQL